MAVQDSEPTHTKLTLTSSDQRSNGVKPSSFQKKTRRLPKAENDCVSLRTDVIKRFFTAHVVLISVPKRTVLKVKAQRFSINTQYLFVHFFLYVL